MWIASHLAVQHKSKALNGIPNLRLGQGRVAEHKHVIPGCWVEVVCTSTRQSVDANASLSCHELDLPRAREPYRKSPDQVEAALAADDESPVEGSPQRFYETIATGFVHLPQPT